MIRVIILKLVILLEYQNINFFLQKSMFQIGMKQILLLKKLKKTVTWAYVISDLKNEEIVATFHEKDCKKKKK